MSKAAPKDLTVLEVADKLNYSTKHIHTLLGKKKLRGRKAGGKGETSRILIPERYVELFEQGKDIDDAPIIPAELTLQEVADKYNTNSYQLYLLLKKHSIKGVRKARASFKELILVSVEALPDIEALLNMETHTGIKPIRCEPCTHEPKKKCATCKRPICLRDYRFTNYKMPARNCKDCENNRKAELRKRKKAPINLY